MPSFQKVEFGSAKTNKKLFKNFLSDQDYNLYLNPWEQRVLVLTFPPSKSRNK